MEIISNHYYDLIYKLSSLTGMWPYLKLKTKVFRIALLTIILLTILVPQIAYQFNNQCNKNLHCTFQAMTAYLLSIVAMVKIYTFLFNTRTIKDLTQHLFCDWKELNTSEEYKIMKSYATNSRRFTLIYSVALYVAVYCFSAMLIFLLMSLIPYTLDIILPLNESRPILLPYRGYYFVDIREYFFQILWHAVVAWEVVIAGVVTHDCLFVTYVEHVCSIFAVIGLRYEHLFHDDDEGKMEIVNILDNIHCKKVALLVHKHREALQYAQLLESIFTGPFAVQILIVTIGMSISLLQDNSDILESTRYVFYVIGQLIHLFFLSFEGQRLIDHSLQICDKIYNSFWYKTSMKLQKIAMMVMMKSVYPSFLSAGKVYIFSLESFSMVLQTSMSYFTVLASFQ